MSQAAMREAELLQTPLNDMHVQAGAKMVPFAGYSMPVQYPKGVMGEHLHTRSAAGLFDVSHMGHVRIHGVDRIKAFEKLVVGDVQEMPLGAIKYSLFTTESAGAIDDLMITRTEQGLYLIVNASRKQVDIAHLRAHLPKDSVEPLEKGLLALQGPQAAGVLARLVPGADKMKFMHVIDTNIKGMKVSISRSGYTGEDGYEITTETKDAGAIAELLLNESEVEWIGLGARDTLRLEAGLCLYGHELDETTSPVEADLKWTIGKRRRAEGGFLGDAIILDQLKNGVTRKRVGLKPEGRAIARENVEIQDANGAKIGITTSGTFGPTVGGPVAIGYVDTKQSEIGTKVNLMVRGQPVPAVVHALPFVPYRYYRG